MRTKPTLTIALVLVALLGLTAQGLAIGPGGAKGRLLRYWSIKNWWVYYTPRTPPPSIIRCHVEKLIDGSGPGGPGAAQAFLAGNWFDLEVCDDIQGLPVRVNSFSSMFVRDPIPDGSELPLAGDTEGACDCELEPGGQVRVTGVKDAGMPPEEVRSPVVAARSEAGFDGYLEYVVDYEEDGGITRVVNSPYSEGTVWAVPFGGPDPTEIPLLPGESVRYLPTGELAGTGTVLVRTLGDVTAAPGEIVFLDFEVWNICETDATYAVEVEDGGGWDLFVHTPELLVPPGAMAVATVEAMVPVEPEVTADAVIVTATDMAEPFQVHSDVGYVIVDETSGVEETAEAAHLGAPHPNPFSGSTSITFQLSCSAGVDLAIIDAEGRRVRGLSRELHPSTEWCPGEHTVRWDGRDGAGREAPAGVYFVRMTGDGIQGQVRPLVLIR